MCMISKLTGITVTFSTLAWERWQRVQMALVIHVRMRETNFARRTKKIVRARRDTTITSRNVTLVTVVLQHLWNSRWGLKEVTDRYKSYIEHINGEEIRVYVGARISKGVDITTPHVVEGSRNRVLAGSG